MIVRSFIVIAAAVTIAAAALAGCVSTGTNQPGADRLYKSCTDATRVTFPSCPSGAGGG